MDHDKRRMNHHSLKNPACPHCCYDLTGTPLSASSTYTCSECGDETSHHAALSLPTHIASLTNAYFLVILPPIALCMLQLIYIALDTLGVSHTSADLLTTTRLAGFWVLLAPLPCAIKIAHWGALNDSISATKTYGTLLRAGLPIVMVTLVGFWLAVFLFFGGRV